MGSSPTLVSILAAIIASLIGLIVYGGRRIINGDLVPRKINDDQRTDFEKRLAREREISDITLQAYNNVVEAQKATTAQVSAILAEQKTTTEVLRALRSVSEMRTSTAGGVT